MTVTPIILPIVIPTRLLTSKMISSRCSMMQTNRSIYNKKYCVRQEPATAVSLSLLLTLVCHVRIILRQGITLSICQSVRWALFAPWLVRSFADDYRKWFQLMVVIHNSEMVALSGPTSIDFYRGPGKRVVIC